MTILIDAQELAQRIESDQPPVIIDVRWVLGDPHGYEKYLAGHIPGAVFGDMQAQLASHGDPRDGRHPLPSESDFQATVSQWGINEGDTVVIYDDAGSAAAARAWWLLGYSGIENVVMLDGGLSAWRAIDGPLETGAVSAKPGDAVVHYGSLPVIDIEQAAEWGQHGILLDARAGERFRGETEPIDPRAGHIPGATSAPTLANIAADGHFLSPEQLRQRFTELGIDEQTPVAVYCGSGVTAAHQIAALRLAGFTAALFPGSWSAWSNRSELPVATGS